MREELRKVIGPIKEACRSEDLQQPEQHLMMEVSNSEPQKPAAGTRITHRMERFILHLMYLPADRPSKNLCAEAQQRRLIRTSVSVGRTRVALATVGDGFEETAGSGLVFCHIRKTRTQDIGIMICEGR